MFPISVEFKAQVELRAETLGTTVAGYIKGLMAQDLGITYDASTGRRSKYANEDDRKTAQAAAAKAKRTAGTAALDKMLAELRAKNEELRRQNVIAEQKQAELIKRANDAARATMHS